MASFETRHGAAAFAIGPAHRRRLRAVWRSAGWPCQDTLEAELLGAGLLERRYDDEGRHTLRVTDAGVAVIAETVRQHRRRRAAHEALADQVAVEMQRAGRIVWRGLSLRAPVRSEGDGVRWVLSVPDVFSIRHSTVEDRVEPIVHEVKVRRADLLADLRKPAKREAYLARASQCWYVLGEGVGGADDVPSTCGLLVAEAGRLSLVRPAPSRPMRLPLASWMALAKSNALAPLDDDAQALLGAAH